MPTQEGNRANDHRRARPLLPAAVPGADRPGGTIPFLLVRVTRKNAAQITTGLRGMYYDTVSGSAEALASACRTYGAGRLLFGTDYPYCDEPQFRHHLSYLSDAGLDSAELAQTKGGTAAALLGVGPVTA